MTSATVPCTPELYELHRFEHRQVDGRWICPPCEGLAGARAGEPAGAGAGSVAPDPQDADALGTLHDAAAAAGGFAAELATGTARIRPPSPVPSAPVAVDVDPGDPLSFLTDEHDVIVAGWIREWRETHRPQAKLRNRHDVGRPNRTLATWGRALRSPDTRSGGHSTPDRVHSLRPNGPGA